MTLRDDILFMSGRVAVITGGSKGIGLAVSTALIAREVRVVIGDILIEQGQEAVKKFNRMAGKQVAVFQYCDVRKYCDMKKLFQLAETRFGGVDIAVMSASVGCNIDGVFGDPMDDEAERLIHDTNVGGVIKGNRVAIMHMYKRGGGCIINAASIVGLIGNIYLASYAATKHAVVGWTRSMEQLSAANIRVNAVCPYLIEMYGTKCHSTKDEQRHPCHDVIEASPRVPMHLVVKAFLACITNHEYNGEALIVTPDGFWPYPQTDLPESCVSESMVQALLDSYPEMSDWDKRQMEKASERYFSKL